MAMTLNSPLSTTTMDVESLVGMAWNGQIRVPSFQRDFRWHWEDVRRLFDSIVRGYPVGSLLLWVRKADEQRLRLGTLDIDAPASTEALWVVDGQQRITSLANALHPDGQQDQRFALAYDLRDEQFVRLPKVEDPLVIPLPVLFDLQKILIWFNHHSGISDRLEQASGVTRTLRQFQVPAYQVRQADPKVLQDIFDRMNNYGKRLSRAEIFSALNDQEVAGQLTIDLIAEHIASDLGFGTIDGNTILQGVLARRGSDVKRDIRDEFAVNGDEGRDAAYHEGEQALRRAVAFLQQDALVPHFSMLAYRYLLPPLARVFAHHPNPDPRNRRLLRRWYWRAAVAGPQQFKAGTGDAARMLCSRVLEKDLSSSVQNLLELVEQSEHVLPDLRSFATNQAATKIVLCSWWAAGPRNPDSHEQYEISDLADCLVDRTTARDAVRYLAPNMSVTKPYRPWAANRVLMPIVEIDSEEVGLRLVDKVVTDEASWSKVLESHAVTDEIIELLRVGALSKALEKRRELLTTHLQDFLQNMCEWGFEDTPSLTELVLDDEEQL
ncbi:DUF262 domain-containing protein [Amycolatopsis minnesotensis]|uniref:GmrSD restriction endonucleases N-terminal domain-containing protein n=1 Tax=Amycolatopsis minnesotensis TaxID=337894 RepID=A0ABN2SNT6_9PSEU